MKLFIGLFCLCGVLLMLVLSPPKHTLANGPDYFLDYVEPDHVIVIGATARIRNNDSYSTPDNTIALSNGLRALGYKYKIVSITPMTAEAYHANPTVALIVFVAPKDSK